MNIPATVEVPNTGGMAVAVWKDQSGLVRYTVTSEPVPARQWKLGEWEPMRLDSAKACGTAAYLATRDADPPEKVRAVRDALLAAYKAVK
jgi:hypothetical protein